MTINNGSTSTPAADASNAGGDGAPEGTGQEPTNQPAGTDTGDQGEPQGSQADDPKLAAARNEAAANRVKANEAAQRAEAAETAAQEAKDALQRITAAITGDTGESEGDPAEQVATLTSSNETLTEENARLRREATVRDLASDAGGDARALLDSRSFGDTVAALDESADDYSDQVTNAIKAAVENNPRYKAVGQVPTKGGAPVPGGSGEGSTTQDEFNAMDYKARVALKASDPSLYARLSGRA